MKFSASYIIYIIMACKDATDQWFYFDKIDKNKVKCKHCCWEKDHGKDKSTYKLKFIKSK